MKNIITVDSSNLLRKALWIIFAFLFAFLLVFQLFGIVVRRPSSGGTGTACARTVSTSTNEYQAYASVSVMASPLRSPAATTEEDGTVELTSDVLLYPGNIIVANGHAVTISGQTVAEGGQNAITTVWVDEDDDNVIDANETIELSSLVMSSIYLYGGSDESSLSCDKISITMTGGEIGAIFAGGYYQRVATQNVEIKILGGSVQYVDCGSQAGPLNEKLVASESISVLLKDCVYRSNFPINFVNNNSYVCKNVSVIDLASHRDIQSYTRQKPTFSSYITPIENKRYVMGGNLTIPSDIEIDADVIVVEKNALVNNLGKVSIPRCQYIYMFDGSSWSGNAIKTSHSNMSLDHYTYSDHYYTCSDCQTQVCEGHVWTYVFDKNYKHTKRCSVCGYSYSESCEMVKEYEIENDGTQYYDRSTCKYCSNKVISKDAFQPTTTSCNHRTTRTIFPAVVCHHADYMAEGSEEYDVTTNRVYRCGGCGVILPYAVNSSGSVTFYASIKDVFKTVSSGTTQITISMRGDAFSDLGNDTIDFAGKVILDMNGCNIDRRVVLVQGELSITNSKFENNHYSRFTKRLFTNSGTKVSAEGCYFDTLYVGSSFGSFNLKNVRFGRLYRYLGTISLSGKIVCEKYLYSATSLANFLPSGYVVGEMKADGTWSVLYDRQSTNFSCYMGPNSGTSTRSSTSYVAFIPCPDHQLKSISSSDSEGHTGVCKYCNATVKVPHVMTSGQKYSSKQLYHQIKCSECSYVEGNAYHDYDKEGKCIVCEDQAAVHIRGSHAPGGKYLLNFDDALTLALNGLTTVDTISLFSNQTNTKDRLYTYDRYQITGLGYFGGGPRIFIEGNGHTLDNTGSMTFPPQMIADVDENGHHYYSFETDNNIKYAYSLYRNSSGVLLRPMVGYEAVLTSDGNYVMPQVCVHKDTHTNSSYRVVSPVYFEGKPLEYHVSACKHCLDGIYKNHTFVNGVCSNTSCKVNESDVAAVRVSGTSGSTPFVRYYPSLYKAWSEMGTLISRSADYTIQLLADIDMYEEYPTASWNLNVTKSVGTLTINATDENGVEHSIKGWYNPSTGAYSDCIINTTNVKDDAVCIIKSGIYQGYRNAIIASGTGHLILEGGTFKNGMSSSYKGLKNAYGVLNNLPDGYYFENGNSRYSRLFFTNSLSEVSGTVKACTHTYATSFDAVTATCRNAGCSAYIKCNVCGYFINSETGEYSLSKPTIAKLLHTFNNNVCKHCGVYSCGVRATKYKADGTLIQSSLNHYLSSAWALIGQWISSAEDGEYYVIKLEADVNLASDEELASLSTSGDFIIDLNGHHLNLNGIRLNCSDQNLRIIDSSKSGNAVLTGPIWQSREGLEVVLDGVQLKTPAFKCPNLVMKNNAGLVFDGGIANSANIRIMNIEMENGCYFDGEGCSSFLLHGILEGDSRYEIDLSECIVDLAHNLKIEQQKSNGEWASVAGNGYFKFPVSISASNTINVTTSTGKSASSCYRWHAEKKSVNHNLVGRKCSVCKLNTQQYFLDDATPYSETVSRNYKNICYEHLFDNVNVWEAMYIPFSVAPSEYSSDLDFADIYSFGHLADTNGDGVVDSNDDTWLIVDLMTDGATEANYPYLIRSKYPDFLDLVSTDNYLTKAEQNSVSCSTTQVNYSFKGVNDWGPITSDETKTAFAFDCTGKLAAVNGTENINNHTWYVEATPIRSGAVAEIEPALSNGIRVMVIGEDLSEETALQLLRGESVEVNLDGQHFTLDGRKATTTQSGLQILNGKTIMIK